MKTRFTPISMAGWFAVSFGYLAILPCFGQGTIYTDRTTFETAISGMAGIRTDVNFQPPLPAGGTAQGDDVLYSSPLNVSGLTFRSGGPLIIRLFSVIPDFNWVLNGYDSLTPLAVDMNGPALAFGADFASLLRPAYSNFLATVTLNNGNVFTFTALANPNSTFFGFVTTQPFSSLTFSDGRLVGLHEEILDNITVVHVPEPGVFALLGLGALVLALGLRRTRNP